MWLVNWLFRSGEKELLRLRAEVVQLTSALITKDGNLYWAAVREGDLRQQLLDATTEREYLKMQALTADSKAKAAVDQAEGGKRVVVATLATITELSAGFVAELAAVKVERDNLLAEKGELESRLASHDQTITELLNSINHPPLALAASVVKGLLNDQAGLPDRGRTLLALGDVIKANAFPGKDYADWPFEVARWFFAPERQARLNALPIVPDPSVMTGMAQTTRFVAPEAVNIRISTKWMTFRFDFRVNLLIHEILHILEAESGLDIGAFYKDVQEWFNNNLDSGWPTPDSNYVKYTLKFQLYSGTQPQYAQTKPGVEEFAYIGTLLALDSKYRAEVSPAVLKYYGGILAEGEVKRQSQPLP